MFACKEFELQVNELVLLVRVGCLFSSNEIIYWGYYFMESHVRSEVQTCYTVRSCFKKAVIGIGTFAQPLTKIRFPFFIFGFLALGLLPLSVSGGVLLCLFIFQYSYCRMEGVRYPGPTFDSKGKVVKFSDIRHDTASCMWAVSFLLMALYCFLSPFFREEFIFECIGAFLLVVAFLLPLGAGKSAVSIQTQKGYLTTVDSGFLAEAGKVETVVVCILLFMLFPILAVGGASVFFEDIILAAYSVAGVFAVVGSLFYLKNRKEIFMLGLPSLWDSFRSISPSIGLICFGLAASSKFWEGSLWGINQKILFDNLLILGAILSFVGAKRLESFRKGSETPVYTHRKL